MTKKEQLRKYFKSNNNELLSYYRACQNIRVAFINKYLEYDDSFWIGGRIGEVLSFSDQFLDMYQIMKVLELNLTNEEFFDWYWWQVDYGMSEKTPPLNIENYIKVYIDDKSKIPKI